jgi:NADH-quinone oxidoreductase subunit N
MNYSLLTIEILVTLLGLGVLLADLWVPASSRRLIGYGAATAAGIILTYAIGEAAPADGTAFGGMFVVDAMSNLFKGLFLLAAVVVLLLSLDWSEKLVGYAEHCALTLFALVGMLFAASANDFILMFVALELITITLYILVSFQRNKAGSIEAGVKYLILGALASGFMVFGTALIFGAANTTNFFEIAAGQAELGESPLFLTGVLLTVVGLGFKIAAFPFQMWAPDVYQGAPAPTVAFLATGSKAAGFVLLLRIAFGVVPELTAQWSKLFLGFGIVTILYGSLCAIPQRSVKRIMGYSSIANAGFLLLGIAAASLNGSAAVMTYLAGYVFTVLAAFAAISVVVAHTDSDDVSSFAGLGQRSAWLATALTVGMVSLAGIPPLAGFFAKLYLLRSVADQIAADRAYLAALLVACVGVVISLYYYFGVLRSAFFPRQAVDFSTIPVSASTKVAILLAIAGTVYLGVEPEPLVKGAKQAAAGLRVLPEASQTAAK